MLSLLDVTRTGHGRNRMVPYPRSSPVGASY